MEVYSVYDSAVGAYGNPFVCRARGEAVRGFVDECMNVQSPFNKHPRDFHLYYLGSYDIGTGTFEQKTLPVRIVGASDIVDGRVGEGQRVNGAAELEPGQVPF